MEIALYVLVFFGSPPAVLAVVVLADARKDRKRRMIEGKHIEVASIRQQILEARRNSE